MSTPNRPSSNKRPLVLLDVDGVINDLDYGRRDNDRNHVLVGSHGYLVAIPDYMPTLVQWLCEVADVHWCTTWRERANDDIATHLGIEPLPVVDDGTRDRHVSWKAAAAYPLAEKALADGRRVLWIEDFYGETPSADMPAGVEFVDTASPSHNECVLDAFMLPDWLIALSSGRAA